jgi:hypothetical protein
MSAESIDLVLDSDRGDLEFLSQQLSREDYQTLTAAKSEGLDQTVQGKETGHLL